KERSYQFNNYFTLKGVEEKVTLQELESVEKARKEQKKALRYIERITDSDAFFERLRKEQEELESQKKKRKWFSFKKGA
ncbi:hypothetical protein D7X33_42940, partial [Butyricicoccus sp. 1XD8-22]